MLAAADQQQHEDGEREPVAGRAADQAATILSLEQQLSAKDWLLTQLQVWTGGPYVILCRTHYCTGLT